MTTLEGSDLGRTLARAADGAVVVGDDGRIAFWNGAAETILGYAARDVIGRPCCEVFAGRDEHANHLCYRGCHVLTLTRMGDAVQNFDMKTQTKGRQPVWLNVSILAVPATTNGGPPSAGVTVHLFRDVTANKALLTVVHERLAATSPKNGGADAAAALTRRELEILRLLATGLNTKTAADRLHVSSATVRNHVQNILGKLSLHSRLEAVAYANTHGLT